MNIVAIKALATLGAQRILSPPCLSLLPRIRFQSTLSTTNNSAEWMTRSSLPSIVFPQEGSGATPHPSQLLDPEQELIASSKSEQSLYKTSQESTQLTPTEPQESHSSISPDMCIAECSVKEGAKAKKTPGKKGRKPKLSDPDNQQFVLTDGQLEANTPKKRGKKKNIEDGTKSKHSDEDSEVDLGIDVHSILLPGDTFTDITYQACALTTESARFPELAPAPFPKDIHLSMPYLNRRVTVAGASEGDFHTDLESFGKIQHNTDSTIYRGTLFEYQTQEILKEYLGIYTQRSAGQSDHGVDLRGTWFLPLSHSPEPGDFVRHLKVIVQCKKSSNKIGPNHVRELQGSLSYETQPTMAILATSSDFTTQALVPYTRSLWPMALAVIDTKASLCSKLIWNRAAERVMNGLHIGTHWSLSKKGRPTSRPILCFDGRVVSRLPGPYLSENSLTQEAEPSHPPRTDLVIPDWDIEAKPEFLHVIPEAAHGVDQDFGGEEAPEDSPESSSRR